MSLTLSVDDDVLEGARLHAEAMGTNVDDLLRKYLADLAGRGKAPRDGKALAEEFLRLSRESNGDSKGWVFDRDEIHERR